MNDTKLQQELLKWLEEKNKNEKEKPLSQLEAEAKLFQIRRRRSTTA